MEQTDLHPAARPGRTPPTGPYRWDDFIALPDDDRRELIDGELVETEVPTEIHEHIVAWLLSFLVQWTRTNKAGSVLASGYKVRVSDQRGVMPDIQFFRTGNKSVRTAKGMTNGAPDMVVEIISPSSGRYDRVTKLNWYARLGVTEYWIVTPDSRTLERYVLREGQYTVAQALSDAELFAPDSFPGLEIPLEELWTIPGRESEST